MKNIGKYTREKAAAQKGLTSTEIKLEALAERFQDLSSNIKRQLKRVPNSDTEIDTEFSNCLKFGTESGVIVDGVLGMMQEREQLYRTIADCDRILAALRG